MPCLRKYLAIFVVLASIFIAVGCSSGQEVAESDVTPQETTTTEPFATPVTQIQQAWTDIDANQLSQLLAGNNPPLVLDLRTTYYYSNKHIAGAESLPLEHLTSQLGELDKSQPIVVYDDNGKLSKEAVKILTENGFKQVYNFAGGMATWGGSVEP